MTTLYVFQEGSYLRKEGERIKVEHDKKVILDIPLLKINQIALFGPVQISTQALIEILKRDIDIVFLTKFGQFRGRIQPPYSKNSILRKAQFKASFDLEKCLLISKNLVFGKLSNMKTVLRRHFRVSPKKNLEKSCLKLESTIKKLFFCKNMKELRGCEGISTAIYFSAFKNLLLNHNFKFSGRYKRPPKDPINALLSFGYTLLFKDILSICELVGFDPYIGFLHSQKYGKPSLALDLMEEWRPAFVDTLVLALTNRNELSIDDFDFSTEGKVWIRDKAKKHFVQSYEAKKNKVIKHPLTRAKMTYWKAMETQVRLLAKALEENSMIYKPFLIK